MIKHCFIQVMVFWVATQCMLRYDTTKMEGQGPSKRR